MGIGEQVKGGKHQRQDEPVMAKSGGAMKYAKGVMPDMNLLFYAPVTGGVGDRLQRVIEGLVPEENTEIYRTIDSLARRLCQPTYDLSIAVLLADSRDALSDILSIRGLLCHLRVIVILPNGQDDTIAKGHALRPRFSTYVDSDFADVAAVLGKMLVDSAHPRIEKTQWAQA